MILIDAGPLVALCDAHDALHATAVEHLKRLAKHRFGTCDAALTEACFHLPQPFQRQRLRAMLDRFNIAEARGSIEPAFWSEVFDWLDAFADHEPDWADGCLAVLSSRDKHAKVWTYDREFATTWRRRDGTAIPLAVRI